MSRNTTNYNSLVSSKATGTDNPDAPKTPARILQAAKSAGEHLAVSPARSNLHEEPICSTPPHALYRSNSLSHSTPEMDFGRQSPLFMSMSQRALKLGVDVTWASSPTRRSASPLVDRKMPTPPPNRLYQASPTLMHHRSLKEPHNLKPNKPPPINGLSKFQEELKSIMPLLKKKPSGDSGVDIELQSSSRNGDSTNNEHIVSKTNKRAGSLNEGIPCKIAKGEERASDYLSTSIQREFLDDSDLDMALVQSSQEVESRLKTAQSTKPETIVNKSAAKMSAFAHSHLFNDSFPDNDFIEELMSSKEVDQLISSQSIITKPPLQKPLIERHKSMPFGQNTDLKSISDEALSGTSDDIYVTASSSPMPDSGKDKRYKIRNPSLGRHNSMPASPSGPLMRHTLATKRRLLKSFKDFASGNGSSEDSD